MTSEGKSHSELATQIEQLFLEFVQNIPDGCAIFQKEISDSASIFKLIPQKENAASLCAIVPCNDRNGITLIAGRGSFFEIPQEGNRYTSLALNEEVKVICLAVMAGKLEEWVVFDGEEVIRGKGIIEIPEPITVRWSRFVFRPFRQKIKSHFQYERWYI